jgi:hypothetical protein
MTQQHAHSGANSTGVDVPANPPLFAPMSLSFSKQDPADRAALD